MLIPLVNYVQPRPGESGDLAAARAIWRDTGDAGKVSVRVFACVCLSVSVIFC